MKERINKDKLIYICSILGYFCLLLIWSMNQEFGSGPEEKMRFQIPQFIFEYNRLPTLYDSSIYDSYWGFSYAGQPCLPYLCGAFFMKVGQLMGVGNTHLYMFARLTSIFCGCIFLVIVIKISKEIFTQKYLRNLFVAIIVLWKYTCYLFTYVNCDSMCLVGVALIILYCIRGLKESWTLKNCVGLALGNSIILLSYINGLSYSIVSVFVFVGSYLIMNKDKKDKYFEMIKKGLGIIAVVLITSAWFYIRNIILYGSLLGSNIANAASQKYGSSEILASERTNYAKKTMFSLKGFAQWIKGQVISFGGQFSVDDTRLSTILSYILMLIVAFLIIESVIIVIKNRRRLNKKQIILIWAMILGCIVTTLVDFYYSAFVTYIAYYARYLMPMIISFVFMMLYGFAIDNENMSKRNKAFIHLVVFLLIFSDVIAAVRGI